MAELNHTRDLLIINDILFFLIENNLESECVEYESNELHLIAERLLKVVGGYDYE